MRASAGKRILMLLENSPFPQDGRVRREATTLTNAGYEVTVICPASAGQRRAERVGDVQVYRYPTAPERQSAIGYIVEYAWAMTATAFLSVYALLRRGFDVVHAHNPPDTFVLIGAFYKLLGKRFVFDHHDLSPEMYEARFGTDARPLLTRGLLAFERLSFALADQVIATNESYAAIARERGRLPAEQVSVVRNGPDLGRVKTTAIDPGLRARAKHIFGYVGLMGFQDGVDYLIRALGHLVSDLGRTDVHCVIIGKGDAVPSLKGLVSELRLSEYVTFTGPVSDDDLMRFLTTADICVDPDPSNPFNDRSSMIKMTEYMALGKPIVAFDLPEHRVTAHDAALYARANDELDFARKLETLMDDEDLRLRMGRIGVERVETQLAWPHQERSLLAAYAKLGDAA